MHYFLSFGIASFLLLIVNAIGHDVIQLHIVSRHGQRELLDRDSSTQSDGQKSVLLTENGVEQATEIGKSVRDRYLCGGDAQIPGMGNLYSKANEKYYAFSSDTERTLMTANAFNTGLWSGCNDTGSDPLLGTIPVHSIQSDDDVLLRSYVNCLAFHTEIDEFYTSPTFQYKVEEHLPSLIFISECFETYLVPLISEDTGEDNTEGVVEAATEDSEVIVQMEMATAVLKEMPNLWDYAAMLQQSNQLESVTGNANCSDLVLEMEELADWVEQEKYTLDNAGNFIGTNFLHELASNIIGKLKLVESSEDYSFETYQFDTFSNMLNFKAASELGMVFYSSHYPMIKGMLTALGVEDQLTEIPEYGALCAFELLTTENGSDAHVQLYHKAGINGTFELMSLAHMKSSPSVSSLGQEAVPVADFITYVSKNTFSSTSNWCQQCENYESAACHTSIVVSKGNVYTYNHSASAAVSGLTVGVGLSLVVGFIIGVVSVCVVSSVVKKAAVDDDNDTGFYSYNNAPLTDRSARGFNPTPIEDRHNESHNENTKNDKFKDDSTVV